MLYLIECNWAPRDNPLEKPYLLWYDMPTPGTSVWAPLLQPPTLRVLKQVPQAAGLQVSLGLRVPRRAAAGLETLRVSLPDGFEHTALARNRDEIDEHSVTLAWRPLQLPSSPAGIFSDYEAWTRAEEIALANEAPAPVLVTGVVSSNGSANATTGTTSTTTSTEMDEMPVPQGRNWVNLGQRNEVQMRSISSRPFPACELLLRFPVQLPSRKPRLNIWYVTLVDLAQISGGVCYRGPSPVDSSVMASVLRPGVGFWRCLHVAPSDRASCIRPQYPAWLFY
ncbi:unnamed protein product [Symbiodinium sp. KB8]|nr:unnamed protein product [Symbiodinium sp. KB8]